MNVARFHRGLKLSPVYPALFLFLVLFAAREAMAQTGGEGAIQGLVTDSTGAAIPKATVTATDLDSGVQTSRPTSSAGLYDIEPLIPGTYTITVTAPGFEKFVQDKMDIIALHMTGLNVVLKVGSQGETVTVTEQPPSLETTNATLGGTIQGSEYMELPLLVAGNQQRDITQFSNLLPGAQVGSRTSVIGGTETRLGEVYVDGMPLTTITQQGDNRPVFNVIPLEAITQIQVVTSGFSAEYQGAGLENYTIKSGGNQYHGTAADFIRNTLFDAWGFSAPWATITNAAGVKGFQNAVPNSYGHISKPADHENELSISIGGPIIIPHLFNGKDKLFFQATVDKVVSNSAPSYGFDTLPTAAMQTGDFTGVGYNIYDPTTLNCPTPTTCTRSQVMGMKNGIPTANVIPSTEISHISQYLQKFLPPLANTNLTNNYIGGIPSGYRNLIWGGRIDYDISPRNRLSFVATDGRRHAVPYTSGSANLPPPYLAATLSTVAGNFFDIEDTFQISSHMVNQFVAGYQYFGGPPTQNNTEGNPTYEATAAGITGVPTGQGSDEFPGVTFAGTNAGTAWSQPDITSKTVSHTFDIDDNVDWVLGRHSIHFGIQLQDIMANVSTFNSYSNPITYAYSQNETAQESGTSYVTATTGFSYASFLLGAINSTGVTLQPFSDIGDRYHPIAPYFQDDFKVNSKLTVNLGLRWDYIPSFRETLDRWSFLNPTLTNPYTGNPGSFQFAGNYGGAGASCGCRSPVNNYWKNFGPRVGFAYAVDSKTVFRGGFAVLYSHGGATGGAGAAATGQTGFNDPLTFPANPAGPTGNPTFYLNNSGYNAMLNNANFGGPGYVLPAIPAPSAATQLNDNLVGNFLNNGVFQQSKTGVNYPDPYLGSRTPTFYYWNFGMQRSITNNITVTANYAGSVSHFVSGAGGIRGLQSGEVNPIYLALGAGGTVAAPQYGKGLLTQPATAANIALAQAILPGCCTAPYAGFTAAAGTTAGAGFATIAQSLKWMPQYTSTGDTFGAYSANASWNAFEFSLAIRPTHGLTFNLNYTYDKELDDAGTIRTGYPIPSSAILSGKAWAADRIDRSLSTLDLPENFAAFGVYKLPFGKGALGGNHFLVRALAGGWEVSGIATYSAGLPLFITSSACTGTSLPNQGTCMPDLNPNFTGRNIRQNGKWGNGVTALTLGSVQYISGEVANTTPGNGINSAGAAAPCGTSTGPFCNAGPLMIGDAPRGGAYGLRGPNNARVTAGVRRTFDITEKAKFILGIDCQNVLNSVTFGGGGGGSATGIGQSINSATFGTLGSASSDARDFQFSGRISF